MFFSLIITVVTLIANWRIFEKMGHQGWKGLIPFYNTYIQFEMLYGKGAKMFLMLIPFYGLYIAVKFYIDLAHAFNQSTGFGWGLALLGVVFSCILAFGQAEYLDGSHALTGEGTLEGVISNAKGTTTAGAANGTPDGVKGKAKATNAANAMKQSEFALQQLKDLAQLHAEGILTDEEFQQKKTELLEKI